MSRLRTCISWCGLCIVLMLSGCSSKEGVSVYSDNLDTAIENGNKSYIEYYNTMYAGGGNIVLSPPALQGAWVNRSERLGIQDNNIYEVFKNGYISYDNSSVVFSDNAVSFFSAGGNGCDVPLDQEAIGSKLADSTSSGITACVSVPQAEADYGVCSFDGTVVDSYTTEEGGIAVKAGVHGRTARIPLEEGYILYVYGSDAEYVYDSAFSKEANDLYSGKWLVKLPCINLDVQGEAPVDGVYMASHITIHQASENVVDMGKPILDLSSGCSFMVRNDRTGLVILIGRYFEK